ncbi:uncharacterized protein LOC132641940 isoform X2 [Lycium barbarum]|uniref:uncharacterized protein LOC132641940 isoform X2 n=1 Tax=Lycium barbarum TaxID=112863 RepID=UPI00293E895A|nr:uncharacterized protein LOC132641940 isoform X2 [Lycium barbarum]
MAKFSDEKSDGLEILSIGKLYAGPWDKKYWSSSRGKDRYPYPIGYSALRTQNGVAYKLEIHEGLNGPLFTISSTDGQSCSGKTPEIACDSFQKKGCQIKLLHGKRYSSKIDGVEFFGFKNTFVQRLLRELVANISGTPEQNFLSSISLRNETSEAVNQTDNAGSKTDPNQLTHLETQSAGKRNRKGRTNNIKSAASTGLKKPRLQNKSRDIKGLKSGQQEYGEHPPLFSSSKGPCNSSEAWQESETLQTINEREKVLVPVVESFDKDDNLKVDSLIPQGGRKHLNPETEIPLEELVANISGGPEQNLSSISLSNETSEAVNQTEHTGSKTDPNLLTHLEKPQSVGKRNRKGRSRTNNIKSAANTSLKKPQHQNKSSDIKALNSGQQEYGEHPPPFPSSKGSGNSSEAVQESETFQTINEREKVRVPVVESFDKDDHLKVDSLSSRGGRKHLNPETEIPLEELVANISGGPEQNLSPISLSNETSEAVNQTEHTGSEADPNLLTDMEKPQIAGKRNRKGRTNNIKSAANTSLNKSRRQNKSSDIKALNSGQQEYSEHPPPFSSSKGSCNISEALKESKTLQTIIEREKVLVPVVESFDKDDHLKVDSLTSQGGRKHLNPETEVPLEEFTEILKDAKLFDRSRVLDEPVIQNQMAEEKDGESPVENETQRVNFANLWAPDTLDHPPDDSFSLTAEIVKDGVAAVTTTVPDSLIVDSHPESEMNTSRLEEHSQRSESDSAGNEIANSMMTFLLPRALPLLRTYTRKKKNDIKSSEISIRNSQDENKKIDVSELDENLLLRQKKENINFPVRGCIPASTACSLAEAVVPDSFDNAEGGYTPSQGLAQILQVAEAAKDDQSVRGLQTCRSEIEGTSKNDNLEAKQSVCNGETEREKDFLPSTQKIVQASRKEISGTQKTGAIVSGGLTSVPPSAESMVQHVSLSESIICRDFRDDSVPETSVDINAMHTSHFLQGSSSKQRQIEQSISADEPHINGPPLNFSTKESFISTSGTPSNLATRSQDQEMDQMLNHNQTSKLLDSTATNSEGNLTEKLSGDQQFVRFTDPPLHKQNEKINFPADTTEKKENNENLNMEVQKDLKTEIESGVLKVIAGYAHPMPISSVLLSTQENYLYICVLCGQPLHEDRTIFMYKAPMDGEERGCPSFIGHVSIRFLLSDGAFGGDIELDSAAVQLTPIGQSLVLFNSVRAPSCREGDMKCHCSLCALNLFEENAIKIVQIRNGYVSLITKLKTTLRVCCILVCPPDHLVAVEESGKLYIWVMNSKWSAETEECCLLPPDCPPFSSTKLKRIPNFASLVLGYNGFSEFSLWDIKKRMLVSKFSAASTSVFQCLPVSLFRWQRKFTVPAGITEEIINEITDVTKMSFLEISDNQSFCSLEDKDVAIWLLISTAPDPNSPAYQSSEQQCDPVHWWRLALLVNNTMIMGNSLDPRATAIGFSAGYGIIGRSDGLVYLWELTTGRKLQNLHYFKEAAVSSIVSEDSSHRAVAIASDGGQLLVYLRS